MKLSELIQGVVTHDLVESTPVPDASFYIEDEEGNLAIAKVSIHDFGLFVSQDHSVKPPPGRPRKSPLQKRELSNRRQKKFRAREKADQRAGDV